MIEFTSGTFATTGVLKIISCIDRSNVEMAELVDYFNKQTAQQKYNDYDGVMITASMISKLKSLIKP
ncbi:hypothetical protein J0383_17060 [Flavobacterium endoglycinae]|uniref:Uncharacterized protein n=1 Tax=Flavobacterium endoglycinae TaxID=2816357 RepID=A0ABX7QAJ8_9FLAO|nr:hypothetical protein [Flavobacterium endoglycinae]QSW87972.1 hypothetical protein J0383_17060 [Flavobacterium endoglycinae]